jgi:hypothetical protein
VMDVRSASFSAPVAELYGAGFREALGVQPASAFLAEGSAVTVYQGGRVS